jgi:hypothetical protein
MNLSANVLNKTQTITVTNTLWPVDSTLSTSANFNAWISSTNFSTSITDPWHPGSEKYKKNPLNFMETLTFKPNWYISQQIVYDPGNKQTTNAGTVISDPDSLRPHFTNSTTTLQLGGFNAKYVMGYSYPYSFIYSTENYGPTGLPPNQTSAWTPGGKQKFIPMTFSMSYTLNLKKDTIWKKRLSYSIALNAAMTLDLQRYTNSNLTFSLDASLAVSHFMDMRLTFSSSNYALYSYLMGLKLPFFYNKELTDALKSAHTETNPFVDLWNSFGFAGDAKRRASGFKMGTMKFGVVHHLGDWDASLDIALTPYEDIYHGTPYRWKINPEIQFLVRWIPVDEVKQNVYYTPSLNGVNQGFMSKEIQ